MLADKDLEKYLPSERAKKAKDSKKCPHCQSAQEKIKIDKPTNFYKGRTKMFNGHVHKAPFDPLQHRHNKNW